MSYNIVAIESFKKEVKQLFKKYPSLKNDLDALGSQLQKNPFLGHSLGAGLYKIRMRITSKGKGKSGGARVITCVKVIQNSVYLLSIYDKSEKEDISDKELKILMNSVQF